MSPLCVLALGIYPPPPKVFVVVLGAQVQKDVRAQSNVRGTMGEVATLGESPARWKQIQKTRDAGGFVSSTEVRMGNRHAFIPMLLGTSEDVPDSQRTGPASGVLPVAPRTSEAEINALLKKIETDPAAVNFSPREQQLLSYVRVVKLPRVTRDGLGVGTFSSLLKTDVKNVAVPLTLLAPSSSARKATVPGWYAGDTHLHSARSDGLVSTRTRIYAAQDHGFDWVAVTDHAQMLDYKPLLIQAYTGMNGDGDFDGTKEYEAYRRDAEKAAALYRFPVLAGLEYSSKYTNPKVADAHFLVFDPPSRYINNPSQDRPTRVPPLTYEDLTGDKLIETFATQCATSIAHPCDKIYPWFKPGGWTDYKPSPNPMGFEAMSYGGSSGEFALSPTLQGYYHDRLARGEKIYLTAGSDDHFLLRFGLHWTFVDTGKTTPPTKTEIAEALANGRTVASTGPFLNVQCEGKGIGSTLNLPAGSEVEVRLTWQYGKPPTELVLMNGPAPERVSLKNPETGPHGELIYRHRTQVKPDRYGFLYAHGQTDPRHTAFTSPIYMRRSGE